MRRQRGFTLIELMVGSSVTFVTVLAVSAAFLGYTQSFYTQAGVRGGQASLRQTHQMAMDIAERWDQAREDAHNKWIEYIRDERYMRDTKFDTLHPQSLHYVDKVVEELNRVEGYERYEAVPLDQLMREGR